MKSTQEVRNEAREAKAEPEIDVSVTCKQCRKVFVVCVSPLALQAMCLGFLAKNYKFSKESELPDAAKCLANNYGAEGHGAECAKLFTPGLPVDPAEWFVGTCPMCKVTSTDPMVRFFKDNGFAAVSDRVRVE